VLKLRHQSARQHCRVSAGARIVGPAAQTARLTATILSAPRTQLPSLPNPPPPHASPFHPRPSSHRFGIPTRAADRSIELLSLLPIARSIPPSEGFLSVLLRSMH
jgi:hypothetical protein